MDANIPTIGLVADSQLQTSAVHRNTSYLNSVLSDYFINVAVRTTAQNTLSEIGLTSLLQELTDSGAEIVFYLGDGLNNGCTDEANRFFDILRAAQQTIPIFMAIGNHDYLAAGNARSQPIRLDLCGTGNRPLSKAEMIRRIHELNQTSFEKYRDTILAGYSFASSVGTDFLECPSTRQDSAPKCFYAATLLGAKHDIVIMDTSHYENVSTYGEFTGAKGFIGTTQVEWIYDLLADRSNPRVLFS
ncbi:MAG: hypothetical protein AAF098_10510, partial [Pseudomonadota bacterium]